MSTLLLTPDGSCELGDAVMAAAAIPITVANLLETD